MMRFFTAEGIRIAVGLVLQASLLFVMFRGKLAKIYPILTIYVLLNLLEDPLAFFLQNQDSYTRFYVSLTVLDYLLQFLIIFEVGWNVIRPARKSIHFPIFPVVLVAVLACAIVAASFSPAIQSIGLGHLTQIFVRITLGLAVMKLLLFAALVGFAQILGIGWKNRVLQVATGLAFFAAVSLFVQISISHLGNSDRASYLAHYNQLNWISVIAYDLTIGYWIWSLSRNEAPRKEFTPQMQEVLVTIAESAKRTRLAVTRSTDRR